MVSIKDKDLQKIIEGLKNCGKCGFKHPSARDASNCLTENHGHVQCYFCLKVYESTEKLFIHFGNEHTQHKKPDHLICVFCQKPVAYKSVSTHVITNHMFDKKKKTTSKPKMFNDGHEGKLEPELQAGSSKPRSIKETPKVKVKGQDEAEPSHVISSSSHLEAEAKINELKKFIEASKVCGKCRCKYSSAREASDCVTRKHNLIRCYFCFKVFQSTQQLFIHFGRAHTKLPHRDQLMCRFCQTPFAYKSVSAHVVNVHLVETKNETTSQPTMLNERPETDKVDKDEPEPQQNSSKDKSIKKTPKVKVKGQDDTKPKTFKAKSIKKTPKVKVTGQDDTKPKSSKAKSIKKTPKVKVTGQDDTDEREDKAEGGRQLRSKRQKLG